jgi:guanine deaminase
VDRIVFAADRHDAADAGFDDAAFYNKLEQGEVADQRVFDKYREPFEVWADYKERIEY